MAITLLGSGVVSVTVFPTVTRNAAIVLPSGSQRRLVVAVGVKYFNTAPASPLGGNVAPTVSFGGIPLTLFTRDTDGVGDSFQNQGVSGFNSRSAICFFGLRESELATLAPGTYNLTIGFDPLTAGSVIAPPGFNPFWAFNAGYWFLGAADQGERIRYFGRFSSSNSNTVQAGNVLQGGASDGVIVAGINGTTSGTLQITINGGSLTEDFDVSNTTGRFGGANFLGGIPLGTTLFDMTYTAAPANSRATVLVGLRIAEFFTPTPGAECALRDGLVQTCALELP